LARNAFSEEEASETAQTVAESYKNYVSSKQFTVGCFLSCISGKIFLPSVLATGAIIAATATIRPP
jgi:hypothetical protein